MLLTREEMHFDFGGAKLHPERDRSVIAWAVQQFLYGEVTGIQVGYWIYNAPDLEAARFLARQAVEEFQHIANFLRILEILQVPPAAPHPAVRFLTTGMMGSSWEEHVALEMALGEGMVLQAFYALIELIDEPEIAAILKRGVRQEEGHVSFGEQRAQQAIEGRPRLRRQLLGLALVSLGAVHWLTSFMRKRLPQTHPALRQLPQFVEHTVQVAELRLQRIGILAGPLRDIPTWKQWALVPEAYGEKVLAGAIDAVVAPLRVLPWFSKKRLTETYLSDPLVCKASQAPLSPALSLVKGSKRASGAIPIGGSLSPQPLEKEPRLKSRRLMRPWVWIRQGYLCKKRFLRGTS